jgi:hypothetical protein
MECSNGQASKAAGEKKSEAYPLGYVEEFFEPRTKIGKERVSARLGLGG